MTKTSSILAIAAVFAISAAPLAYAQGDMAQDGMQGGMSSGGMMKKGHMMKKKHHSMKMKKGSMMKSGNM